MTFSIRPYSRFSMFCPVTYHASLLRGQGTVWNVSLNGWRLSGDLPLRIGEAIPLTVTLPHQQDLFVAAAIVRWRRGQECGFETLVMERQTRACLQSYVKRMVHDFAESVL
jgi:PilZ domain-containing protein